MNNIIEWDYEKSVEKVKPMVMNWKNITVEIVKELYIARGELAERYPGKNDVTNVTSNWSQYLKDVGLQRMTVHRWLDRYEPEEQRLLTDAEYENKQSEKRKSQNTQPIFTEKTAEENEAFRKKIREESEAREQQSKQNRVDFDEVNSLLDDLADTENRRREIAEKMNLSGDNAEHNFNTVLIEYLDSLRDDSERLEACHNIIKICKGFVNQYQKNSMVILDN